MLKFQIGYTDTGSIGLLTERIFHFFIGLIENVPKTAEYFFFD